MSDSIDVQFNNYDIKQALKYDAKFFVNFFLHEELTHEVPPFHEEIFYDMTTIEDSRVGLAIPRAHAKTTLAKLAVVWYFLFTDWRFIIYVSNTASIAIPAVNDIIGFMQSPNFEGVFGKIEFLIKRDGTGVYKFKIGDKVCILRAHGAQQQVRGINIDKKRPQLAIIDDLEDNDNIATEDLFLKLKKWVFGPFMKALDLFDNKIIWLGNLIKDKQLLHEICESDQWTTKRFGCLLQGGIPLWPDLWPIEKLREDFKMYQEFGMTDVWFAEMMNMPVKTEGGIINANQIIYMPVAHPQTIDWAFITVDLAISKKAWAHKTTVTVHAKIDDYIQVVDSIGYRGIDPISLFDVIVYKAIEWGVVCIGIENVAFQESLQYIYPHFCLERQIEGLIFVPLTAEGRKTERIITWAGYLKRKEWRLTQGDFVNTKQLLTYDPIAKENDDDHIDGAAYGPQMINKYMTEILTEPNGVHNQKIKTAYSISKV